MTAQSDDKLKFWAFLIAMMLGVSVAVLLIDMTIKAAILEESNALRRTLLGVQSDGPTEANPNGTANQSTGNSDLLDFIPTGMEAGNVANGHKAAAPKTRAPRVKRAQPKPRTQGDTGEVPSGD